MSLSGGGEYWVCVQKRYLKALTEDPAMEMVVRMRKVSLAIMLRSRTQKSRVMMDGDVDKLMNF